MPAGVEARIFPEWSNDNEPIEIRIKGATHLRGKQVQIEAWCVDSYETFWALSAPSEIDLNGSARFLLESGFEFGRECSVYVHALIDVSNTDAQVAFVIEKTYVSVVNPSENVIDLDGVARVHERLLREQTVRYTGLFGDPSAKSAKEHRVLSIAEGLLLTTELKFPGVRVVPLDRKLNAEEERSTINGALEALGWACRLGEADWLSVSENRRPLVLLIFQPVYATDFKDATELVRLKREEILALLALNRHARGQSICTVVEQRLENGGVSSKWFPEQRPYQGNLIGGFIAGESQQQLMHQLRGIENDPLLGVCCDLLGEAFSHNSDDAQYLRYWSVLELLSDARVARGQTVSLRNGDQWPQPRNKTKYAKPRVYYYLDQILSRGNINEQSFCHPAKDLLEAVSVWYVRRNVTAHQGRFDPADSRQKKESWFSDAAKTSGPNGSQWLMSLREAVMSVIRHELAAAGQNRQANADV